MAYIEKGNFRETNVNSSQFLNYDSFCSFRKLMDSLLRIMLLNE